MTRTPDEIKKGLECCAASYADCHKECPYKPDCDGSQILKDALALIQQLEAERDAAVADIDEMVMQTGFIACEWCDHCDCESDCSWSRSNPGFKWRGVQKEE